MIEKKKTILEAKVIIQIVTIILISTIFLKILHFPKIKYLIRKNLNGQIVIGLCEELMEGLQ